MIRRRLWTLYEMLELNASAFCRALSMLSIVGGALQAEGAADPRQLQKPLDSQQRSVALSALAELNDAAALLGATTTGDAISRLSLFLKERSCSSEQARNLIRDVESRLADELRTKKILCIEGSMVRYYEPDAPLFGPTIPAKFHAAIYEIDESGKCLALGRSTAAVFHLMRTMEIGIRAVAKCLGIPDPIKPSDRNWGTMLRNISHEFTIRNARAVRTWSNDDKQFFDAAYASLDAVKNAWRNPVMHVEGKYTDDEAEHVFFAARGFMKKIAERMDEYGEPAGLNCTLSSFLPRNDFFEHAGECLWTQIGLDFLGCVDEALRLLWIIRRRSRFLRSHHRPYARVV